MTPTQIIRHVNDGANFYVDFFADADHMSRIQTPHYTYTEPKPGEQGINFVYNIALENLPKDEQAAQINAIKALHMPAWWNLQCDDDLYKLIFGKEKSHAIAEPVDGDELYMALLPGELNARRRLPKGIKIKKVVSAADFAHWAKFQNDVLCGGHQDIHPQKHYRWCGNGKLRCFAAYCDNDIISVASIMRNDAACSLEFVATHPDYRRQGLASAVCSETILDAFESGAEIVTLRAINPGTRQLYCDTLGFTVYNFAL
ncbi:hypothetical protein FACS1894191_7950 [Clostridia bacterium]|nr:hypothetical protein FACS1894191_7950 [Clostridia bacterium]